MLAGDRPGEVLAFRRAAGRSHAGLWEFPGGKVEPGETDAAAVARELLEELSLTGVARRRLWSGLTADGGLEIVFYETDRSPGPVAPEADHDAVASVRPEHAEDLPWAPVDRRFLQWLAASARCDSRA